MIPATLTGLAVGDALGMPFETCHFSDKKLVEWDGSFQASEYHKLGPGQWTDDTQMATALAKSLVINRTYAPADVAQRYLTIHNNAEFRGVGRSIQKAMERLTVGMHWISSGIPDAEGNGTAMRIAPLGLFLNRDMAALADFVALDARITHKSLEAQEGAKAVALAVAILARGDADQVTVLPKVLDWLGKSRVREGLEGILSCRPENTLQDLVGMGTSAHIVETVPAAFRAFCGTDTFKKAVTVAVRAGGDTDTVAAITGALAGTFYGTQQVDPWLAYLEDGHKLRALEIACYNT